MMRFLGLLLAFLFVVPLIRSILGLLARAFTSFAFKNTSQPAGANPQPPRVPSGGTLRKDPVCGTYVSEALALKRVSSGETFYYCSEECKKKHLAKA
ncbi:hypothetical protein [Paludibaculum fermentans]|uniref:TRASH domain-containing protein n=1 Tax=Paludibaculum fermentans TaxID=1473598 RepID=A0A7S7SM10_PALFE|nr:hypothetical protein [Paludibaculum fermentans]QOY89934.1 hypothetical protein IRI77_08255 [Paludibaculum fermentans]